MAIQALFLDFGNIFSTFEFARFYRNLRALPGVTFSEEEFHVIAERHYWPYDSGKITSREYHQRFIEDMGSYVSEDVFEECFLDIFHGHVHALDALLGKVREDIPLYLISNTNEMHYRRYISSHPFLLNHIDKKRHVLSFRVGVSKPDLKIYRHALDISGIKPHEGFFVDDLEKNIHAWQSLGGEGVVWHGQHHDISALEEALNEYGILE